MINYDDVMKENIKDQNWLQIPNHPYRILIIGGFGSGKTNALFNLIKIKDDDDYSIINKIYLHVKDPNETKYQNLIKRLEKNGLENLKDPEAFT